MWRRCSPFRAELLAGGKRDFEHLRQSHFVSYSQEIFQGFIGELTMGMWNDLRKYILYSGEFGAPLSLIEYAMVLVSAQNAGGIPLKSKGDLRNEAVAKNRQPRGSPANIRPYGPRFLVKEKAKVERKRLDMTGCKVASDWLMIDTFWPCGRDPWSKNMSIVHKAAHLAFSISADFLHFWTKTMGNHFSSCFQRRGWSRALVKSRPQGHPSEL